MKIKSGFVVRDIGGKVVAIAVGERSNEFNGMINLNQSGKFVWQCLEKETTVEEVAKKVVKEYDITIEEATEAVVGFVSELKKSGLIEE